MVWTSVALISTLALAGCAGGGAAPTPTPTRPAPSAAPAAATFEIAPLTGAIVAAGSVNRPSLAVKVDNHEDARPQWALNQTDLLYEELVEGGLTRYVAVWQSTLPADVGPVRSIRPMDPDIISPLGGIAAYSGGQTQFVAMMQAAPVVNISADSNSDFFYRIDSKDAPHNEILKAQDAVAAHADLAKPAAQFSYGSAAQVAAQTGDPTSHLSLEFSAASERSWDWDAANGVWLRSQDGVEDNSEGEGRTRATNVVTIRVNIDWTYGIVPKTTLVDSGEALVSVAGKTIHGSWSKASQTAPIVLKDATGNVIRLLPGNTWIELVPNDGSVTIG